MKVKRRFETLLGKIEQYEKAQKEKQFKNEID
jgi:hypothetical protein